MSGPPPPTGTGEPFTEDRLLGGRVALRQPRHGLRAGLDAVLLAAGIPARPGERVLEAGCGSGRFAEIAAERAGQLVCLDYSSAVVAAADNLRRFPNVHVVQGDALQPPFRPGAFAYLYSIGVMQHTARPLATIARVVQLLAPGGRFALTIYGRAPWTRLYGKYLVRRLLRTPAMPPDRLLAVVEAAMPLAFPLTDVLFRLPLLGALFRFAIPVANYVDKREFTREQRYAESVLDTFDMLSPRFDRPLRAGEVARALRHVGARDVRFLSGRPVVVQGRMGARQV